MDFDLTEEQLAVSELAARVLGDLSTPERLRVLDRQRTAGGGGDGLEGNGMDRDLWAALADVGLTAIVVPEELGGAGLGLVELCGLLREVGRRTAAVPALATLAGAALPIARHGSETQRRRWLPGIGDGSIVATAAIVEPLGDPRVASLRAERVTDGWRLDGERSNVAAGMIADLFVVPASSPNGTIVALIPADSTGLERIAQRTTSGATEALVRLSGVVVGDDALLGGSPLDGPSHGDAVHREVVDIATVAACAVMAGVSAEAVRLTGDYATQREQFGRPIAAFQAVTQRAADAYVDAQAIELTMLQAAWRLDAGLPADREIAVAKFYAAEAGQRALHAAQHLHGGMGVDRDYPLHRYFLLGKELELFLGGGSRQLLRLGAMLAADGVDR